MAAHNRLSLLVTFLFLFWSTICEAQNRVYRADTRSPEEIRAAGGFRPRGQPRIHTIGVNISLYNHAIGAENGQSRDNDGYVSTAATREVAQTFMNNYLGGTGWIYEIAATPNFVSVPGTLLQFNPYPAEEEYAALGGIHWEQIVSWTHFTRGVSDPGSSRSGTNSQYERDHYNHTRPVAQAFNLAGFPVGHQAWSLFPWNGFADCNGPRSVNVRRKTCFLKGNNYDQAKSYMYTHCGPDNSEC